MTPLDPGYVESAELREMGFAAIGEDVSIGRNCTVIGAANISIGNHVRIDGPTAIIAARGALTIGDYVHIGGGCHLSCAGGIEMADFAGLSQGVRLYSATDDYSGGALTNPMVPARFTNVRMGPVRLGRHVILGAGSVVLPRIEIGEGSAVGALTLVNASLAPWGIYAGQPARWLLARSRDLLEMEAAFLCEQAAPEGGA
ncbi:MAG: acyltransferase [Pseudomonadota bacterium]